MEKEELLEEYHSRNPQTRDSKATPEEQWRLPMYRTASGVIQKTWWQILVVLLPVFQIGVITGIVVSKSLSQTSFKHWTLSYSPVIPHVSFKTEKNQKPSDYKKDPHFLYSGPITLEQEQAWADLLYPVMIAFSRDEMKLAHENPDTKVQYAEERDKYAGTLGVFHELHCLRRVRRFIHQEYWYGNSTIEEIEHQRNHADHCLEKLHRTSMCFADAGMYTFEWNKGIEMPALVSNSERMCVDWDQFRRGVQDIARGFAPPLYRPDGA